MKYLKSFESTDHDTLKYLKTIHGQLDTLKTLMSIHHRKSTPSDIYEDYFLEFKEIEKFKIRIGGTTDFGAVQIDMWNMIDLSTVESELDRYTKKLKSIKARLDEKGFNCHFRIQLNGTSQSNLNTKTHRNDDYKFKGVGDKKWGYDGKDNIYSDNPSTNYLPFPDDKVSIIIKFLIV